MYLTRSVTRQVPQQLNVVYAMQRQIYSQRTRILWLQLLWSTQKFKCKFWCSFKTEKAAVLNHLTTTFSVLNVENENYGNADNFVNEHVRGNTEGTEKDLYFKNLQLNNGWTWKILGVHNRTVSLQLICISARIDMRKSIQNGNYPTHAALYLWMLDQVQKNELRQWWIVWHACVRRGCQKLRQVEGQLHQRKSSGAIYTDTITGIAGAGSWAFKWQVSKMQSLDAPWWELQHQHSLMIVPL